uniref:Retinoblastoma-like protein n=1 Tax=Yamagishiella unicocca TaxID=51707 RepID=N0DUZ5_9CHLO|nr:retinoblastoma-like protein [Yamagishiella unicocca]BAN18535.1 retinoblastoma-like protein [Yamagishiella unicocca]
MDVALGGGIAPIDRVSSLLKGLKVGSTPAVQEGVLQLYAELKDCYEAQERAAPAEYAGEQDEDVKQACKQASLLFVARVLFAAQKQDGDPQPANLGCSISRIVAAAGINLLDFFREVNVVVSKLSAYFEARGGSSKLFTQQAQLKENSETVVVMGLLAKKYKDNFNMFLHQLDYYKQVVLRLGWTAFLVLRVKLLSAFPDVVSCVELLPCIFAILASHAPRLPDCLSHISRENRANLLLKTMSEMCKADYSRVQARMPSVEALLTQIFTTAVPEWRTAIATAKLQASQPDATGATALTVGAGLDLVANPILEGLVTDSDRMNRAVAALEVEYEQHYVRGTSELDERDFLSTDFTKFASPRFSPGQMHSVMTKLRGGPMPLRPGDLLGPGAHTTAPSHPPTSHHMSMHIRMDIAPGLHSPLPMMHLGAGAGQPGTPVSEVMGASAWLRGVTANLAPEPSPVLQRFLAAVNVPSGASQASGPPGSQSLAVQLSRRVRDMVASVIPDENGPSVLGPFPLLQPSLAAERRMEATKLYYHSLETILMSEEKASGLTGVTALLVATKFHRGLVACCVEVVSACYRMVSCAFPKVLDSLRIKAFDLAKMIQNFVKSIATLPRELKRHLFLIEEKILESLAWEPGSSLYHLIINVNSENEAAAAAQEAAAQATCSAAASGDDSQHDGSGSKAGPSSSSAGAGGAEGAAEGGEPAPASSSHEVNKSGAAPMETVDGSAAGATVAPTPAPAAAAPLAGAPPPSPKRSQASVFSGLMSPAKKARGVDGTPHSTQTFTGQLPQCIGVPPAGIVPPGGSVGALHEFCRKVLKLASFRLALMCNNFDFAPLDKVEVSSKVYETIEYALYRQTHLFYNRHIDQIMLSALYGYCKVHKLAQVSFREIIAQYRKQPQAQQAIFRSVIIEQSNPGLQISSRADIIAFYNQVFVPSMKAFLLKGEPGSGTSGAGLGGGLGGADSKPVAAGNSGNADDTMAASTAAGGGTSSGLHPGLPPLPPRSSSQSPRAAKLPVLSGGGAPVRMAGRSASLLGRDGADKSTGRKVEESQTYPLGPAGSSTAVTTVSSSKCEGSMPLLAGLGSRHLPSAAASQTTSVAQSAKASGPRTRAAASSEHKIPDGLAALLQALDSQAGAEGPHSGPEADEDDDDPAEVHAGPVTRSGRAAAAMASAVVESKSPSRVIGISAGRERRSTRQAERKDDGMDADGPAAMETSEQAQLAAIMSGRRQRTPNRRYGSD